MPAQSATIRRRSKRDAERPGARRHHRRRHANTSAVVNGQTVEVIASQPVPDTPANRKAYGQPMSRAGKRTAPAGN